MRDDHGPHISKTNLSQIILGGQDGLVNVLGVILGVAAASGETRIVLAGGLAATFAESVSMAAVAYTSEMAQRDHYFAELHRQKKLVANSPEKQKQEIYDIYQRKGFSGKVLSEITGTITANESAWIATIMREKLGLAPINTKVVVSDAAIVGISAVVGSFIPLVPFFFMPVKSGVVVSLLASTLALFAFGIYKAKATIGHPLRSGLEMALIGMSAAIVGYGIGTFFNYK